MAIKINHLSYTYLKKTPNEVEALNDVSLEIPEGKITTIIGHTGSGKSTLIQTLNGLLLPTSGTVEIGDFIVTSDKRKNKKIKELRKHVSIVFQFPEYQLFEKTDIIEKYNLAVPFVVQLKKKLQEIGYSIKKEDDIEKIGEMIWQSK